MRGLEGLTAPLHEEPPKLRANILETNPKCFGFVFGAMFLYPYVQKYHVFGGGIFGS
jgi:hypothetical protein